MKKRIQLTILFFSIALANTLAQQEIIDQLKTKMSESERARYLGIYLLSLDGKEEKREIQIRNDIFFYIVNEKESIPLKVIDKKNFELYPSATHIHFEFSDNGEVKSILIITGSENKIKGIKLNN
jgi:hypothetical protein